MRAIPLVLVLVPLSSGCPRETGPAPDHAAPDGQAGPTDDPTAPAMSAVPEDLLRAICHETCGGAFAFVTPYRDTDGRLVRLELRGDLQRCSHPPTLFFDAAGTQTGVIPEQPVVPGSEEALGFAAIRDEQTGGLVAGDRLSCSPFHEAP